MATRDEKVAGQIAKAQGAVEGISTVLGDLSSEAGREGAPGHAGLYHAVQVEVVAAYDALAHAWDIMVSGDPERYA